VLFRSMLSLPPGIPADLSSTLVAVYASYDDWTAYRPLYFVAAAGVGSVVTYQILNIPPGMYYLDAWKDNDNDGVWSFGDFYGLYGAVSWPTVTPWPFPLAADETRVMNLTMTGVGEPTPSGLKTWGQVKALFR